VLVNANRLGDLRVDLLHRIQRVHGALEDQRHVAPAHEPHAALGAPRDVDRLSDAGRAQRDRARLLQARGQQLHHRERGRGLSAPGLAREPQCLARGKVEVDPVDNRVAAVRHAQIADLEQAHPRLTPASPASAG
jgi:hypothetical protein